MGLDCPKAFKNVSQAFELSCHQHAGWLITPCVLDYYRVVADDRQKISTTNMTKYVEIVVIHERGAEISQFSVDSI